MDIPEKFHVEMVYQLAKMYNHLDVSFIEPYLAKDCRYESQHVFEPMIGRECIIEFLRGKFETVTKNMKEYFVFAEIGYLKSQKGSRIQIASLREGEPCVLLAQGDINKLKTPIFIQVRDGQITAIDICGVNPGCGLIERSGIYPS